MERLWFAMAIVWPFAFSVVGFLVNYWMWAQQKRPQHLFLWIACVLVLPLTYEVSFSYWGQLSELTLYGLVTLIAVGIAMSRAWIATQPKAKRTAVQRLNRKLRAL